MEATNVINDLGSTHILLVLKPVLNFLDPTDKEIIRGFLKLKFPEALNIEALKDTAETDIFLDEAYKTFKEIMSAYVEKLGNAEIRSLEELMDIYGVDDEECFQELSELINLIKERISPEEIDEITKANIYGNIEIISNVLQTNSRKSSKESAKSALQRLSDIYQKRPGSQGFISAQLSQYEQQIKFIATEFCGSDIEKPAEKLSLFQMIIRKYRVSEN